MRTIGSLLAMLGMLVGSRLPNSAVAEGIRYSALAYIWIDVLLQIRAGYIRRRPHWTSESWRRYLLACAVPVGALLLMFAMMFALEWRLPIVGAPRTALRSVWIVSVVVLMIVGAVGLAVAIAYLARGDASRQFALRRRRGDAAV